VRVYLNGEILEIAEARNLSVVVTFTFGYGDVLALSELSDAVNVINSLSFTCSSDRPRRWLTAMTAGNVHICDDVTVCSSTQYQSSAATPTSDTVCMSITSCLSGLQHQTLAATSTTDTICNPVEPVPCTTAAPAHMVSKCTVISTSTAIVGGVSAAVLMIAVVSTVVAHQKRLNRPPTLRGFHMVGCTYAVVSGAFDGDCRDLESTVVVGDTDDGAILRTFVVQHEAEA
jgi:hypothetical protein